ncbi:MAG: helix-turn-helix transcriptional regulator [Bacteroidales bacterium]|nr:helix-turn-helix transcriptional regulator [Bacteroidales bacterium]
MIKRIKNLISVKNLTASQFADLLGVQRSNISHILSGRNKPSLDFILKITEHFPTISIEWLLNGKGEMFNNGEKEKAKLPSQLEILTTEPDFKQVNETLIVDTESKSEEKKLKTEILEGLTNPIIETQKEENQKNASSSLLTTDEGIEKIMVLYKNGSFRVYIPQK